MRYCYLFLINLIFGLFVLSSVGNAAEASSVEQTLPYNYAYHFSNGSLGWSADFAEYPAGEEEFYELAYDFAKLPKYLATNRFALLFTGNNHSDDLCMFLRKKVTGLKPNTHYQVLFKVTLASNAPKGAGGIGGAPGESVFVKAGVALVRPAADPISRALNIDKGNQAAGGADAVTLGHIGVNTPIGAPKYIFKTLRNNNPFMFRTDGAGEAWLFFAIDSGYEGKSRIYVASYKASFAETQ